MKLNYSLIIASMALASIGANAQSSIDAYQISSSDLNGTARFQAMGGAFTALGGDVSTMSQNPAGIGVYRSSELGISMDVDVQSATASSVPNPFTMDQTKVNFTNCSYVGSIETNSDLMPYFTWGFGYNRAVSFDRKFSAYCNPTSTSLSNYVAYFTNQLGYTPEELLKTDSYDPYTAGDIDWMSILAYNSYMINPVDGQYQGLYQNGTQGDCSVLLQEKGRIDEYNIDFGGNFANTVYWGLGFGITDLSYTRYVLYDESMGNARIPDQDATGVTTGSANFSLDNLKGVDGTGFNIKFGLIFRPINEFRIGAAIHTPTWYSLNTNYDAIVDYDYTPNVGAWKYNDSKSTNQASFSWRLRSPWKFMFGAAGVLMNRFIISADYEYQAYQNMHISCPVYDNWGYQIGYQPYYQANQDISDYFQNANIVRLGAEFRALPWLSLRLGYNWRSSNVTDNAKYGNYEILTNGTDASYVFDNTAQYITAGIGIRYEAFYFDMAYVHKHLESTWHAYSNFEGNMAPTSQVTNNNNKLVFSMGFKF